MDNEKERLAQVRSMVVSAFERVSYPGDSLLADTIDPVEEERIQKVFTGKNWKDWTEDPLGIFSDVGGYISVIGFMSIFAVHYFFPIFLLGSLDINSDILPADLLRYLRLRDESEALSKKQRQFLELLSSEQIGAVIATLQELELLDGATIAGVKISEVADFLKRYAADR